MSHNALKFRDVRETVVGGVPVTLLRLSFSGELGFEIYCAPQFQLRLWEAIEDAGADLGLRPYGARALMSLRLEKGWGVWTMDFRLDYTAAESGLDAFIDWSKDFVGKAAAEAERARGPKARLVTMVIDTEGRDVVGDEAILQGGICVGHVTSGGYAHVAQASVAMGYVPPGCALDGTVLQVEINGTLCAACVVAAALVDPDGRRMCN